MLTIILYEVGFNQSTHSFSSNLISVIKIGFNLLAFNLDKRKLQNVTEMHTHYQSYLFIRPSQSILVGKVHLFIETS